MAPTLASPGPMLQVAPALAHPGPTLHGMPPSHSRMDASWVLDWLKWVLWMAHILDHILG